MAEPNDTLPTRYLVGTEQPEVRVDLFLARETGRSRAFIQYQIDQGNLLCNGHVIDRPSLKVKAGDEISVQFKEEYVSELKPVAAELDILFEDPSVLVINKPQGWVVHPATAHRGDTLVHYLLHYFQSNPEFTAIGSPRPGIVHRLDRGTSGVLLIAKNRAAQEGVSKQFKDRVVKKEYEALVWGKLTGEGRFESTIGRHRIDRKRMSSHTPEGRDALTLWKTISHSSHLTHVALFPHTGRTHQLRVHLSENGNPIVGDALYDKKSLAFRSGKMASELCHFLQTRVTFPFLHARKLTFLHPKTDAPIEIIAPRPKLFDELLNLIKNND